MHLDAIQIAMEFNHARNSGYSNKAFGAERVELQNHNRQDIVPLPSCVLNYYQYQLSKTSLDPTVGKSAVPKTGLLISITPCHPSTRQDGWTFIQLIFILIMNWGTSKSIKSNPTLSIMQSNTSLLVGYNPQHSAEHISSNKIWRIANTTTQ